MAIPLAAQSIFTVAGGGSTNQQSATAVTLRDVRGIAVDSAGNIYFSESDGHVVQRVDPKTGLISVYAGNGGGTFGGDGGPAVRAALKGPRGLAFDADDNLYIADHDNNRIRKVDRQTGTITTIAGVDTPPGGGDNGPARDAFVFGPTGVTWHDGSLYIVQDPYNANVVRKIDAKGIISLVAGIGQEGFSGDGGLATQAALGSPGGVAIDANGNIYIADSSNNRVRRVDATTGNIETVVGNGQNSDEIGDGGPGTSATLFYPRAVAFDAAGKLYIADTYHSRVRKYDPVSKIITTVAGNGDYGGGDGNVATEAGLYATMAIAFDRAGNLFVQDGSNSSIRRVDATTQIITTIAGGGTFVGDGLTATSAILSAPRGLALDKSGNLYIADAGHTLVRKVDATTHVISTFAGIVNTYYGDIQDGMDATAAAVGGVMDVAVNDAGEVFIANPHGNSILKVDTAGKISKVAGGGSPADGIGDGGPATAAQIFPRGIGLDAAGNLYITDTDAYETIPHHRIRRVDVQTKVITTIAGGSTPGFAGDGGDAKSALLDSPDQAIVDATGNIFIADSVNGAIRRIDAKTNIITTYAGRGNPADGIGDGLVATSADLYPLHMALDRSTGDLYVADMVHQRIRKIDAKTQIITTIAGTGENGGDFGGDNGPALAAKLNLSDELSGIVVDRAGNVILADTVNHRVREVFACTNVAAPALKSPANGATNAPTAPALSWDAPAGAFRYDVFLDTIPNPARLVASDIDKTSFTPSNLAPNTVYYWSVKAKGDAFCPTVSTATSATQSFTTAAGRCAAGPFDLIAPADGATNVTGVVLSWQPSAGAASYDVYFGNVNPPPFLSNVNATSLTVSPRTGTNYWTVIAHASCDATQTASTPVRSFTPASTGTCTGNASVTLVAPPAGATGVASSVDLAWRADTCSGAPFDVYLGTQNDPPLLATNVSSTTQHIDSLLPSTTYYWKVTGSNVNGGRVSSAVASFTTRSCVAPEKTIITFAPANAVGAGSTYTIIWQTASGLDPDGGYLVERSTSPTFAVVESQVTLSAAASFIAGNPGTYYHRVRALPSCDPSKSAPPSDVAQVAVTSAKPNVVFTVQPTAVVSALGDRLEDKRGSFTLENIGSAVVNVSIGRTEINNSPPFFTIIDPLGNDVFVTLEPRKPRTFEIRYSGPSNTVAGSYQGVIQVAGGGLPVIPYAFVELRVGEAGGAVPQFLVNGVPSEYLSLPGRGGTTDGTATVSIRNNGTTPMELASEVGPEVWLVPERGWNGTPIAPGATRTVNLNTRRLFAPNGSPLPRYTYFTVRTKEGASARLLVQDNDAVAVTRGRTIALGASDRSFIVPEVTSRTTGGGSVIASRIRLTNAGTDAVTTDLIFTPAATDGFDASGVRRTVVVAPPNDVVTLVDPLTQLMGLSRPASGQLEIRIPNQRLGLIAVNAATVSIDGNASVTMPLVNRLDGARGSEVQSLLNVVEDAATTTSLVLAETSGLGDTTVRATLFDSAGTRKGDSSISLRRYGYARIDNIAGTLGGGSTLSAGRIELAVTSGAGSVIGVAIVRDRSSESGASFVSTPTGAGAAVAPILGAFAEVATGIKTTVVPVIGSPSSTGAAPSYQTSLTLSAASATSVDFKIVLKSLTGGNLASLDPIRVSPLVSVVFNDVMKDLFNQPSAAQGSLFIDAPAAGKISAVLQSAGNPAAHHAPSSVIPVSSVLSELVTSGTASMQRPLFFDGLEQSTDSTRGSRWLLMLNEIGGAEGQVRVLLFEAGNRSSAIAEKQLPIRPYEQMTLDTVFAALGLDAADRKKDRTNVGVTVIATAGSARVTASAISIDNRTGDTKVFPLTPSVGSATPGGINFTAVPTAPPSGGKRRAVRH
ncbi:MAG TPA: hypothetical protein VLV78_20975 [Thermoanaerobaculia bacterium]|nr:hypothetical protein [Thermoanaerobaculia bacterium]